MAGNWKMYKTPAETTAFFEKFRPLVANAKHCEIVICPPFPIFRRGRSRARNKHSKSARRICIGPGRRLHRRSFAGHASRRWMHAGDRRAQRAPPVFRRDRRDRAQENPGRARGRTDADRVRRREAWTSTKAGETDAVLSRQLRRRVGRLTPEQFRSIVIAYEPVWAIGTGKTATPEIAAAAHRVIRTRCAREFGAEAADAVPDSVRRQREAGQRDAA